jgi:hypothetical protein
VVYSVGERSTVVKPAAENVTAQLKQSWNALVTKLEPFDV